MLKWILVNNKSISISSRRRRWRRMKPQQNKVCCVQSHKTASGTRSCWSRSVNKIFANKNVKVFVVMFKRITLHNHVHVFLFLFSLHIFVSVSVYVADLSSLILSLKKNDEKLQALVCSFNFTVLCTNDKYKKKLEFEEKWIEVKRRKLSLQSNTVRFVSV